MKRRRRPTVAAREGSVDPRVVAGEGGAPRSCRRLRSLPPPPGSETKVICTPGSTCATHSLASSSGRANSHARVKLELDVPVPPPREDVRVVDLERYLSSLGAAWQDSNYAKGKWVADEKRPLYSGNECKQWLSKMWACRMMQRTDFSYESYRWQPHGCEMPEFSGPNFLKRMRHKTLAFVGDSLGRQQFQSMMCIATGGKYSTDVEDVGWKYGLVKAPGALRPDGWAYRFPGTNTTILFYWSASLSELEPLNTMNSVTSYSLHLDRPVTFLKKYLHSFDVLVLNTGHHWNRGKFNGNHWELYADGKPVGKGGIADLNRAKNLTLHSIARWVDSELVRRPQMKVFLRTMSPRHFVNGDWNTGGSCGNTIPLSNGSEVLQDHSSDLPAEHAVNGTRVKLLDITAISQLRDEGHISNYSLKASTGIHDCLHWCLPGIPDMWNELLFAQI